MKQVFQRATTGLATCLAMALAMGSVAGAQVVGRGRKSKALPPLAHVVVTVVKGFDGKPMPNVAVVFHCTYDGRDDGNLEIKTDPHGNATIDVIQQGSDVNVQVIAEGFSTFAKDIYLQGPNESLTVEMKRPHDQISQFGSTVGDGSAAKPGIQEPPHPVILPPKNNLDGYALPSQQPSSSKATPPVKTTQTTQAPPSTQPASAGSPQ